MDKDSIILKYEQEEMRRAEKDFADLQEQSDSQRARLKAIQDKMDQFYVLMDQKTPEKKPKKQAIKLVTIEQNEMKSKSETETTSYDELFNKANKTLIERGFDVDLLDYHALISQTELDEITKELNRPLPEREKWIIEDFKAVFIATSIGSLAEFILSDRTNSLTGKNSSFSKWLNQFHQHEGGAPIDYQGTGFGGGYHRGLSKGHDVMRFIEAIMMFKNGRFEGVRYENGIANKVISSINQNGNPYQQLPLIESIVTYAKHMFADLFSTCSLPFPGSSILVECDNRQIRKFAADMYHNGFNIKNIMIQSISTIIIEIILRMYFSIQSVKMYQIKSELAEDYSNIEDFKCFIKPNSKEKLHEMLLVSHAIVTASNIRKVVILKKPWEINVTEIISVVSYCIKVVEKMMNRNSEYEQLIRNADGIHNGWKRLEEKILYNEEFENMAEQLFI